MLCRKGLRVKKLVFVVIALCAAIELTPSISSSFLFLKKKSELSQTHACIRSSADLKPRFIKHIFFFLLFLFAILFLHSWISLVWPFLARTFACKRSLRWERQNKTNDGWKRELITLLINYLSCSLSFLAFCTFVCAAVLFLYLLFTPNREFL